MHPWPRGRHSPLPAPAATLHVRLRPRIQDALPLRSPRGALAGGSGSGTEGRPARTGTCSRDSPARLPPGPASAPTPGL